LIKLHLGDPNGALARHKAFLKNLENHKINQREEQMLEE
jgi:hypothetical protein